MTADVEMEVQAPSSSVPSATVPSTLQHLKEIASLIETGAQGKEVRRIVRAMRLTMMLRRKLRASVLSAFLGHVLPSGSEAFAKLSSFLPKVLFLLRHSFLCKLFLSYFLWLESCSLLGYSVAWAVIVRLLLGEIPERTVFMHKGMKKALTPYFELTNVSYKFSGTFSSDRTHNLIVRLRHNVIRTGLRNISISYSRISLADIARKLRLDSPNPVADAESIVAKAIRDGAIDATIDHANGWVVSKETGDVYSTNEPQIAFNSRIAFCLNMHNEAVRALRFPPNSNKEKESEETRRERQQQEQELAKHIAEEDDDDF
ncbi:hypothetical protein BHM03_00059274 [Ensete ventricosum]|nr:hypothetical protein BHM03_00059274 [Ensete ventricosum]